MEKDCGNLDAFRLRLSKLTIGLGIYIVLSAAFMLQVRTRLVAVFGQQVLTAGFKILFILVGIIFSLTKCRLNSWKFIITLVIFILAYLFAAGQPYFSEKTHVLTYGLLGYLTAGDLSQNTKNNFRGIFLPLLFISFISGLDETFQYFLPYRVGEIRDFLTNIVSGSFGLAILLLKEKRCRI